MAKRQKNSAVSASFHYLIKTTPNDDDPGNPIVHPFTDVEFERVVNRISATDALDETDMETVARIKDGKDLPFGFHEEIDAGLHFGEFEGAYYGQKYRNNLHGEITADSLNLRQFNYLITKLRDGKILVGVTYNGQFGDYQGMRSCLSNLLHGNHQIESRTIKSISTEIGNGVATELKLTYRKQSERPERPNVFGRAGVIAIKGSDYGEGFDEEVKRIAGSVSGGNSDARKATIARLVNDGDFFELNSDDIIGCTAIVRQDGRTRTVYFLGDNNFATKFALDVVVDEHGVPDRNQVKEKMVQTMREKIIPLMA